MSDVSPQLYWEILTRVPAEPLLRFRCVCKSWRRIIDDPDFIKSHLLHQNSNGQIIIRNNAGTKLYTVSLDSLYYTESRTKTIWAAHIKTLSRLGVPRIPALPVSSCDGLILISHFDPKKVWAVWNPFTQESLDLPELYYDDGDSDSDDDGDYTRLVRGTMACGGIGYDRATDDYKVVRLAQVYDPKPNLQTLVYNIKLDCWRKVQDFPNCIVPSQQSHGVFVNGALHWITYIKQQNRELEWIIAFDLGTESYKVLRLPSVLYTPSNQRLGFGFDKHFDVLDGCLFVSCCYFIDRFDGWMMKDYGETNSWTKLFSLTNLDMIGGMGKLRPIAYLKSKNQVLIQHDGEEFFWFDVEKKSAKKVTISGVPNCLFSSQIFPASLVRLNTFGDGSLAVKATAKGKRKNANDIVAVKVTGKGKKKNAKNMLKLDLTTFDA